MKVKRIKAKLITMLALVLGLSMCCGIFTASASAKLTGDEFTAPTPAFYEDNFENGNGAITDATRFWGNAALSWETENPLNGTKSVKAHVENGENFATLIAATNKFSTELNHTYAFSFKVKVTGLTKVCMVSNYGDYAEANYQAGDGGEFGWTSNANFIGFTATKGDDYYTLEFEKNVTSMDVANGNLLSMFTWGTGDLIIDDFRMVDKANKENTYYTVQYGSDFENEDVNTNAWEATPFWSNGTLGWETEYALEGGKCLSVTGNVNDDRLIVLNTDRVVPKVGETWYFEFKIDIVGYGRVTMVSNYGGYAEASYENGVWTGNANFVNFSAVDNGNYFTISFSKVIDSIGYGGLYNLVTLYGYSPSNSATVLFDDFFCYKEDNAPSTQVDEKNFLMNHPEDVAFTLNLKENAVTSVNVGAAELESENYTLVDNLFTLKKEYLATLSAGTELAVTVATAGGELDLTVNVVDDKTEITAISGVTVADKVYDGTTDAVVDVSGAEFTGIETGDALTLTFTAAAFADAGVGEDKAVVLTGIALGGANAGKYVLADGVTVTLAADITVKTVSYASGATVQNKTYDKTTDATVNVADAVLTGVVGEDDVAVTATAVFDNAAAGTGKNVSVTLALTGDDAANYVLETSEITLTADITKKAVTVTADAKTVTEGETAELTYQASGLLSGDTLTGALAREEGEAAGVYKITQGTLANANYEITFVGADYTIEEKPKSGCKSDVGAALGAAAVLPIMLAIFAIKRKKENI